MKKIGNLYGKPVVIGDPNEVKEHQLLAYDTTPIEVPALPEGGINWRVAIDKILSGDPSTSGIEIFWNAIVKAIENKTNKILFSVDLIPDKVLVVINGHLNFFGSQDTFNGGMLNLTILGGRINGAWGAYTVFVIASNEGGEIYFNLITNGAPA